jgi:hypothetical protein
MNTHHRSMYDYKRLAGIGSSYTEWKSVAETRDTSVTVGQARIRRMANLLDEERMGGSLQLPQFDPERIEKLTEAAQADGADPRLKQAMSHHWAARNATGLAHTAGDHHAAQEHHAKASELHKKAAKHLAGAGDPKLAHMHDQWARHHEQHAAHHARVLGGVDHTVHQPPAPAAAPPAEKPKKAGLVSRLKAKLSPKAKETAQPAVHKDPFPSKKATSHVVSSGKALKKLHGLQLGVKPKAQASHEKHSELAMKAGHSAAELATNRNVGSKQKAERYKTASHEHLHAALSAFHSGDHAKALSHFNAAVHHMNKHAQHMDDHAAQERHTARRAATPGPRARVGRG